eukprot:scaffold9042_cov112-Isochrysis_galbana.AAC.2
MRKREAVQARHQPMVCRASARTRGLEERRPQQSRVRRCGSARATKPARWAQLGEHRPLSMRLGLRCRGSEASRRRLRRARAEECEAYRHCTGPTAPTPSPRPRRPRRAYAVPWRWEERAGAD